MSFVKYGGMSKHEWLASPQGQEWLARKIKEKRNRPEQWPKPFELRRTRFPCMAAINGVQRWVYRHGGEIIIAPPGVQPPEVTEMRDCDRTETRDGQVFTVTVLPDAGRPRQKMRRARRNRRHTKTGNRRGRGMLK